MRILTIILLALTTLVGTSCEKSEAPTPAPTQSQKSKGYEVHVYYRNSTAVLHVFGQLPITVGSVDSEGVYVLKLSRIGKFNITRLTGDYTSITVYEGNTGRIEYGNLSKFEL